jgi:hypothetical protein
MYGAPRGTEAMTDRKNNEFCSTTSRRAGEWGR